MALSLCSFFHCEHRHGFSPCALAERQKLAFATPSSVPFPSVRAGDLAAEPGQGQGQGRRTPRESVACYLSSTANKATCEQPARRQKRVLRANLHLLHLRQPGPKEAPKASVDKKVRVAWWWLTLPALSVRPQLACLALQALVLQVLALARVAAPCQTCQHHDLSSI